MIAFVVVMLWTADPWRHSIHVARLWVWSRAVTWAGNRRLDAGTPGQVA